MSLSKSDIIDGLLKMEPSPVVQEEKVAFKQTSYNLHGKQDTDLPEDQVYARRIAYGNQQVKHFIRVDIHSLPLNPKAKYLEGDKRRAKLLGTPESRLVPVPPLSFTNYLVFLDTGSQVAYNLASKS